MTSPKLQNPLCPICGSLCGLRFSYDEPPKGETRFPGLQKKPYHREIYGCRVCGHFIAAHDMNLNALYDEEYVRSKYEDQDGVRKTFEKIISLPPEKSDNVGRVAGINQFAALYYGKKEKHFEDKGVLDVGAGLCVFLFEMKKSGWRCTALDPDERAAQHARETVGIEAIHEDFFKYASRNKHDLIAFNKVLEHVPDPIEMLRKASDNLQAEGLVYLEVPDGEEAQRLGSGRQEFFVDHLHVFSAASLNLLCVRAGYVMLRLERLQEPSGKCTLRAYLRTVKNES